ncbi:MAG: PilZ domain-containing protein [Eubacteriales bacterium]|nr:PilZ domain-containing protein [Eubacteriales bacterium]
MGNYNLDEKFGLLIGPKKLSKTISKGLLLLMEHYRFVGDLKVEVTSLTDSTANILVLEERSPNIVGGDFIILKSVSDEFYMTGTIKTINGRYPFEFTTEIHKIDIFRNSKKSKKFDTSLLGSLKVLGIGDNIPAIIKRISMEAVKLSCREDIPVDKAVYVNLIFDTKNKITFRGKVVKKDKFADYNDYGIEITDFSEENKRNWYRYVSELEN